MSEEAILLLEGRFDESMFRGVYQRNNKRGGLKNLRCFPSCSAEHRVRGFCGRSVVVTFRCNNTTIDVSKYRAFLEFEEEPYNVCNSPIEVSISEIQSRLRTKSEPTNALIEGRHAWTKDGVIVFEFNQERRGWHYSWGSNKHKCDTKHHLVCLLYEETSPGMLTRRSYCYSPEFVLFCRRRRRFTLEPTAGTTVNTSSSNQSNNTRKSALHTKFMQEIELLSTVHRIEASRTDDGGENGKKVKISLLDNDVHDATKALLSLNPIVPIRG